MEKLYSLKANCVGGEKVQTQVVYIQMCLYVYVMCILVRYSRIRQTENTENLILLFVFIS
jgi:hypothetical protein